MKKLFIEFLKKDWLIIATYFILILAVGNSVFSIVFRQKIINNTNIKEQVLAITKNIEMMNTYINLADLGLRGYMLIPEEQLLSPSDGSFLNFQTNLNELRSNLIQLGYDDSKMDDAERVIQDYMKLVGEMIAMCKAGNVDEAIDILATDPGYKAWQVYSLFDQDAREFIDQISVSTYENYSESTFRMMLIQIVFFILSTPVLIVIIITIRKSQRHRKQLYQKLDESDRQYIFKGNDKDEQERDESDIISRIINNLKQIRGFIQKITEGDYSIFWPGLNENYSSLNSDTIAGELTKMRDQMKSVKEEDEKRIWVSQGLSDFATIIRNKQSDFKSLSEELISSLVKYLDVQMGGIFILNRDHEEGQMLELTACYAYNRLKTLEKKIPVDKGLVGQCYLEGETIYMTKVPQDFVNITSGLGDTRPGCILIVPLKLNDNIEGVVELASLKEFEDHEIEFVEKLGETIASAITTTRASQNTKVLLEQTQQQAEEMRAQEEEMRQNMEELQATQEQMHRKNEEVEALLKSANEREEYMKKQNENIQTEKKILETETAILNTLMDLLPERITIKDDQGKFLKISESKYKTLRAQGYKNMIGKSDLDIFGEEHFKKSFAVEKELMMSKKPVLDVLEHINISKDHAIWGLTSRVPFVNKEGKVLGTIVVTRDITKEKNCEDELQKMKASLS